MFAASLHRHRRSVAAIVAVTGALAAPSTAAACGNADANPHHVSLDAVKQSTLCLLNVERKRHGIRPLSENPRLSKASQRHANDMVRRDYFAHGDFVGRIKRARYLNGARSWTVGENIAWGSQDFATPRNIVEMWMDSPGHRRNILQSRFREIGIGVARGAPVRGVSESATYATDFGARG